LNEVAATAEFLANTLSDESIGTVILVSQYDVLEHFGAGRFTRLELERLGRVNDSLDKRYRSLSRAYAARLRAPLSMAAVAAQ
jgi:hypothetical protein